MILTPTDNLRLVDRTLSSPIVMKQDWTHLLFLHWEFPAHVIQQKLPKNLYLDTYKGKAYLGLVPFFMEKIRPAYLPCVPGLSWFQELNLRTYVYDKYGRPGVWFFTLDCNQWLAVNLARKLFHLPYNHAKMTFLFKDKEVHYTSQRQGDDIEQVFKYPDQPNAPNIAQIGSLEFFLLERYRLFSKRNNGEIYQGLVSHQPYKFEKITISQYSTQLFSLCDFPPPETPPVSSIIANNVSVNIHPLKKLESSS